MADISSLGGLRPIEPLNLTQGVYKDVKESTFRLPPKGRYTFTTRSEFPPEAYSRTKAGALQVEIAPTITGGEFDGFNLKFQKVSAKTFQRSGENVSYLGDYLRACGFNGVVRDEQEQADAAESTANSIFVGDVDWRAYNSKTKLSVDGMTSFPKQADGSYQSWIEDPNDLDAETGKPKKVRANLQIVRFIPAE